MLCSSAIETKIGRSGATASKFELETRPGFGTSNDELAGLPPVVGGCIAFADPTNATPVSVMSVVHRSVIYPDHSIHRLTSPAYLRADVLSNKPLDLVMAHNLLERVGDISVSIKSASGQTEIRLSDTSKVKIDDLNNPDVQRDYHGNCPNWKDQVEAFARLAKHPDLASYTFVRVQILLGGYDEGNYPTEFKLLFNSSYESYADGTVLIGAVKLTPFAELARYEADSLRRQGTIDDLKHFLNAPPIPLLEPDSSYELDIDWQSVGDQQPKRSKKLGFKTTRYPPSSALPYLLTVFPQADERFHYLDDKPGLALASADVLRMLAKFLNARIRVRVTEDAGNPVYSPDKSLQWSNGVIVDPATFIDPLGDFFRRPHLSFNW